MFRIGPQIAAFAPSSWIAAGSTALLVLILCALAFRRPQQGFVATAGRFLLIVIGAALSGSLAWAFFSNAAIGERSALEARAGQLTAQALVPGSPLACLDPTVGDTVQAACEGAIFASPASVAAAVSFVAAQFALLSDMTAYARRGGAGIDNALLPLRRALEADPFGFLAHVLVRRGGCTSADCPALAVLHDPSHVRTNIIAQTLSHYVDHYRQAWARSPDESPVADTGAAPSTAMAEANAPGRRKAPVNIDFPTAASIPPISIMNPEPKGPANAEAERKQAARPPAHDAPDPVWAPAPSPAGK